MDTKELTLTKSDTSLVIHPDGRLEPVYAALNWKNERRPLEPQRVQDWIGTSKPDIVSLTSLRPGARLAYLRRACLVHPRNDTASKIAGWDIYGPALFVHPEDILPD